MNRELEEFTRSAIKAGLAKLPKDNQMIFKRMYSHEDLEADIDDVVDVMDAEKLDWAMQQVQRSIEKIAAADRAAVL